MLHLIKSSEDSLIGFISQDPVRPHIPAAIRFGNNRDIFVSRTDNQSVRAITCVSYQTLIPCSEEELFEDTDQPSVMIFYTIWSYEPGAGRDLIFQAKAWAEKNRPEIKRFITLSPPTDMARKFHLKNGAVVYRINDATVNYEYI